MWLSWINSKSLQSLFGKCSGLRDEVIKCRFAPSTLKSLGSKQNQKMLVYQLFHQGNSLNEICSHVCNCQPPSQQFTLDFHNHILYILQSKTRVENQEQFLNIFSCVNLRFSRSPLLKSFDDFRGKAESLFSQTFQSQIFPNET